IGVSDFVFCAFDFGDAPASYGTALADDGARHVLGRRSLWLGANPPDGEADGAPGAGASDDDTTQIGGVNDEDGVAAFPAYDGVSSSYSVTVNATNNSGATAHLVGYIDWNRDGDFLDAGERSGTVTVPFGAEASDFTVTWSSVPANAGGTGATYARFRISTDQAAVESPLGQAPDGEVEDYLIPAGTLPVTLAAFESGREGRGWRVSWWTADESLNAGFRLWGIDGSGARRLAASLPSGAGDSLEAQRYEVRVAGDWRAFELEDLAIDGRNRLHGPFAAGARHGEEPARRPVDWAAARAETGVRSVAERAAARPGGAEDWVPEPGAVREGLLLVSEPGIQRVTYEELLAAGIDLSGIPAAQIALLDEGKPVARRVEPPGVFGRGSYLEFLARPALTLASPVDAFELRVDPRSALAARPLPAGGGPAEPAEVRATDRHAPERAYSFSAPNGDPWYDQRLLAWGAPAATSRTFDLPDLLPGPVALTVELWGGLDFPEPGPDHHVVVRLNGSELAAERFDGIVAWTRTFDVEGLVAESGNQLEILLPFDTGHEFDIVHLEGFAVEYPRRTV
ncbi:MAG TPA: GEVED domain-containing protein, partial [Thermoanaerobaculia bacterium]|nr:GEVED domain-containing protein [Thermoanaerobaculia bacterium]